MSPIQTPAYGHSQGSGNDEPGGQNPERFLTLLAEGTAQNMPEIDAPKYTEFRANVGGMARQVRGGLPDADKLALIQTILHEFETYRASAEGALRDRQSGWRALGATLLHELLACMGIGVSSAGAIPLVDKIGSLASGEEIQIYRELLAEFLHPFGSNANAAPPTAALGITDLSTTNDNACGLLGGGKAVEDLKKMMQAGRGGYVVSFRLGCLNIINERFGGGAMQDCLMAVSAFITHSLRNDDFIYHWSDSTLLAILQERGSKQVLTAELNRIATMNREITIEIGGRTIMLRIPLEFDITPISRLKDADELYIIARERVRTL
jgi:GGDEF domain-containing protein